MNEEAPVTGVTHIEVPSTPNRFVIRDGTDPSSALRGGLEISAICVIGLAVILTLYYTALRILVALFPPKQEDSPATEND